jgi:hypothetical protein
MVAGRSYRVLFNTHGPTGGTINRSAFAVTDADGAGR